MSLPKPDFLHPAMRHLADDRDVVVDPHAAGSDLAGGAQGAVDVAGPGRGGQPVRGVVGQRDGLVVGVERAGATSTGPKTSSRTTSLSGGGVGDQGRARSSEPRGEVAAGDLRRR